MFKLFPGKRKSDQWAWLDTVGETILIAAAFILLILMFGKADVEENWYSQSQSTCGPFYDGPTCMMSPWSSATISAPSDAQWLKEVFQKDWSSPPIREMDAIQRRIDTAVANGLVESTKATSIEDFVHTVSAD